MNFFMQANVKVYIGDIWGIHAVEILIHRPEKALDIQSELFSALTSLFQHKARVLSTGNST